MPPIIDVIRHAEATHNTTGNVNQQDPDLTPNGEAQASKLGRSYAFKPRITHVVSSPMRRAIRTALIAFEDVLSEGEGKKVVLLPELQETGVRPSDTGQSPEALEMAFGPRVDTSPLDSDWCHKDRNSKYFPDVALVEARAREARVFLRDLARRGPDDAHIVVVSHGGFIHFLTEDFSGLWERYFTSYGNTTMRSFQFVDLRGDDDPDARMVQTHESCRLSRVPRYMDMSEEEKARCRAPAVARVEWQKRDFEYLMEG
ncbi:phosphoglycerate mutase-like protein [Nemania sp. NC0429]|nr:phosphoglycerate mutase-like protein [Nemania sp. NC0429]